MRAYLKTQEYIEWAIKSNFLKIDLSIFCEKKIDLDPDPDPDILYRGHIRSPEFKFRFAFFSLQMLRFSALCGPNEQKFGELLT